MSDYDTCDAKTGAVWLRGEGEGAGDEKLEKKRNKAAKYKHGGKEEAVKKTHP